MRRLSVFIACVCSACSTAQTPVAPGIPEIPTATLEILQATVGMLAVIPPMRGFASFHEVKFLLRETSGKSGATIRLVEVKVRQGYIYGDDDEVSTGEDCWRRAIRVEAGATLDIFSLGHDGLGSCQPAARGEIQTSPVRVVVTFTDDQGLTGIAEARAVLTP